MLNKWEKGVEANSKRAKVRVAWHTCKHAAHDSVVVVVIVDLQHFSPSHLYIQRLLYVTFSWIFHKTATNIVHVL